MLFNQIQRVSKANFDAVWRYRVVYHTILTEMFYDDFLYSKKSIDNAVNRWYSPNCYADGVSNSSNKSQSIIWTPTNPYLNHCWCIPVQIRGKYGFLKLTSKQKHFFELRNRKWRNEYNDITNIYASRIAGMCWKSLIRNFYSIKYSFTLLFYLITWFLCKTLYV